MPTPSVEEIWLDPRRAKQIVYNLLSNALKFTPAGGVVGLALEKVDRQRLQVAPASDRRVFAPRDSGHADWLETQVGQIRELGAENYLTQQL